MLASIAAAIALVASPVGLSWIIVPVLVIGALASRLRGGRSGWRLIARAATRLAFAIALSRQPAARGHAELRSLSAVLSALGAWVWPPAALLIVAGAAFLPGMPGRALARIDAIGLGALAAVAVAAFGYLWRTRTLRLATGRVLLVEIDLRLAMLARVLADEARHRDLAEAEGKPLAFVDPGERVFDALLRDLVFLPRAVVAPVVRFYEEERAAGALARETGGAAFDALAPERKCAAVALYYRLLAGAQRRGQEARRRLRWYLHLRPLWPL